ncbi:flagellin [Sinorhizobium fredii USDA 205]|uniref:Flagellin n=1 Tax=Rhizobium fredii TaxID=380 RepID=A0A844AH32_RHIFR|nr:flagellin [Sinorhizobium fredii]AWM23624.1 Flagellin protein FlaA [Sinorhizobium fredii CCBAU 25509]KSV92719.1 flagellin [Sinorhizobium fredii USDA 205]MCG5476566.1 flagellin [Sinorhizobium fredii]MQW95621.1 flagellin [Sinorhizobium fredii]MQX10750.1 flagellin [Sinorhizobium fredii]
MASILTNTSAMAALSTLRSISSSMEDTQNRISTGLRVGTASDNAAYWSIATTMRSDNAALSSVTDALGMGAAKVDTAYAGMQSAIDVVTEIKSKIVAASEEGVDKAKIQEEIGQLQEQLLSIAESASFNGQNWIAGGVDTATATLDATVVSGFVRDSNSGVSVKTTTYTLDGSTAGSMNVLFGGDATGTISATTGILGTIASSWTTVDFDTSVAGTTAAGATVGAMSINTLDITSLTATELGEALTLVEAGLDAMTSAASELGSISTRIDLQSDFVSELSDSIESGIGRLVDADMNEESTRLKALQTQQQLAIQALSIANSDSQNILSLFR